MVATKRVTADELAELDEDLRVELIEGELAEMSPAGPKHIVYSTRLGNHLRDYERTNPGVRSASGQGGYILHRNPDTVLEPDVVVLSDEQWRVLETTDEPFAPLAPLVAIEIRSPSERAAKVNRKTALYLGAGVHEVWWIWPEKRQITVHRQDAAPRTLEGDAVLESPELPGFRLPLPTLFGA